MQQNIIKPCSNGCYNDGKDIHRGSTGNGSQRVAASEATNPNNNNHTAQQTGAEPPSQTAAGAAEDGQAQRNMDD